MGLLGSVPRSILRSILAAFSFLTRLPIPGGAAVSERDLGRSVLWFPLVGFALGATWLGAARVLQGHLAAGPTAVMLVALLAALTGGLHLDGVADTFDALGGGRGDRTRMLEIMRDSRIGAHGATALCLVLVGKIVAVHELLERDGPFPIFPLLGAPVFARFAVVPLLVFFRYARPAGLGSPFRAQARAGYAVAAALLPIGLCVWAGSRSLIPAAAALAAALACGLALNRRLGGLTGDVYGAAIELAELVFLISAA
jgi:adenosylcobinamide-GDP ribazoletransferase